MSELTERLRHLRTTMPGALASEAATEIDRLTLELANARAEGIHSCHDGCTRAGCVNARLREEVERERARPSFAVQLEKVIRERDALRARVAAAEQASRWESDLCGQALERIKVLEDALRGLVGAAEDDSADRWESALAAARAALGEP